MFEKIKQALLRRREKVVIDPSRFSDPVADVTEWGHAKRGGTKFRTHKLVSFGGQRMGFKGSIAAKIFSLVFAMAGLGVIIGFSVFMSTGNTEFELPMIIPFIFGTIFFLVGYFMYRHMTAPIVFDKNQGFFWKGRKNPREVFNIDSIKVHAELDQIHAIQILSEYCHTDKSHYYSYELNLVLKDSSRINVIDHGNLIKLREDANTLAGFLEVPIWDVV
ncbi:MAG: hypothetical protein PF638_08370 [Candidatus Delongbacteria bacterium]|jgi:hypothetical protein|nr:hypothetical protein [Candidatus Delongbacteria bacterium]